MLSPLDFKEQFLLWLKLFQCIVQDTGLCYGLYCSIDLLHAKRERVAEHLSSTGTSSKLVMPEIIAWVGVIGLTLLVILFIAADLIRAWKNVRDEWR